MQRILTVDQVAELLQLTPTTIRAYLKSNKIPGRKMGKAWRILESDIERFVHNEIADPETSPKEE